MENKLISYAKEYEDIILGTLLHDVENGKYIDIGASDPVKNNVTNYFYQQGWCGINVEPLTEPFIQLKNNRERDTNLCVGIGEKDGLKSLYQNGEASSFEEHEGEPCKKKIFTLSEIYRTFCKDYDEIHFCHIDTNGYEADVLKGIDNWGVFRPWVYAIKSVVPGTSIPSYSDWEYILMNYGYFLAYAYGAVRYYVAQEHRVIAYNTAAVNAQIKMTERSYVGEEA